MARGRMEGDDKIDSREIHSTLVNVVKPAGVKLKKHEHLPGVVFDIGRLYLSENSHGISKGLTHQPTDYRVFLEWTNKAIWLFYEYYRFDSDDSIIRFKYQKNNTLARKIGKDFDSAKILDSVEKWRHGLRAEDIKSIIQKNGFESSAYITPALVTSVKDPNKSSRNKPEPLSSSLRKTPSKLKKRVAASIKSPGKSSQDEPEPLSSLHRRESSKSRKRHIELFDWVIRPLPWIHGLPHRQSDPPQSIIQYRGDELPQSMSMNLPAITA